MTISAGSLASAADVNAALATKVNDTGDTITGTLNLTGAGTALAVTNNATVGGNATVSGTLQAGNTTILTPGSGGLGTLTVGSGSSNHVSMSATAFGTAPAINGTGNDGLTISAKGIQFNASPVWSGSAVPLAFHALSQQANYSGTSTASGALGLNNFAINADTLVAPIDGEVFGWNFQHNASAGYVGGRAAGSFSLNQVGQSGNKASGAAGSALVGVLAGAQASFTEGGTDTTRTGSYGQIFGANVIVNLNSGATNFNEVHSTEFNLNVATGASVYKKTMVQVVGGGLDAVKGSSGNDIILLLAQQESAGGGSPAAYYDTGLQFGDDSSSWPFGPSAALIGAAEPQNPLVSGGRQAVTGYGVNFDFVEFGTAAWKTIGSQIDGSGVGTFQGLNIGNWSLSLSGGALSITSSAQQSATLAVHSGGGGSGWVVGDKFTFGATGVGKVLTVTSGAAVTVSMLVADVQASPPSNPITSTATNVSSSRTGGASLTLDATWTTAGGALTLGTPLKTALLTNAVNDAAAAAAGVVVGQFYRNGSIVMQRVA